MKDQFELELPELLYFIKSSCHESLHDTLSELREMTNQFLKKPDPEFSEDMMHFLQKFIQDVQVHLLMEENTVFPTITKGQRVESIPHLIDDHFEMRMNLMTIRSMTGNYMLTGVLDERKSRFFLKLKEMDRIILNHVHFEDHILFPMIQ